MHLMKEWFYDICQMKAYCQQRKFEDWIADAQGCGIKEFEDCAREPTGPGGRKS